MDILGVFVGYLGIFDGYRGSLRDILGYLMVILEYLEGYQLEGKFYYFVIYFFNESN
jgi:hypothetical protein